MVRSRAQDSEQGRITVERAARLYRILHTMSASGPMTRAQILKKLKIVMRTFYRDLDFLRSCGIIIHTENEGYSLQLGLDEALRKLPFPNPELTFGEVALLLKGKSTVHDRLRKLYQSMTK